MLYHFNTNVRRAYYDQVNPSCKEGCTYIRYISRKDLGNGYIWNRVFIDRTNLCNSCIELLINSFISLVR